MKALTICQPYAALIVRGEKLVENREWPTGHRGRLLIHAGKSRDWLDDEDEPEFSAMGDPLVFGAVVGEAQLVDVLHIDRIERGECDAKYPWLREHMHTAGTWCWVLQNVKRYAQPMPWKGAQGLWDLPDGALGPNVQGQGRCAALSRSVPCTAVLGHNSKLNFEFRISTNPPWAGKYANGR